MKYDIVVTRIDAVKRRNESEEKETLVDDSTGSLAPMAFKRGMGSLKFHKINRWRS